MARIEQTVASQATIDLNSVATWVRVVESGSFTAAARSLGLPKSSVSRAITRLERELGSTLLQRTTRKLTLTRAGETYLASARGALRALDEARVELMSADAAPRGTVRVTAPIDPNRFSAALASALAEFSALYPNVQIDMLFTGRRVDLIAEGVDIALRGGKLDDSSLVARRIVSDTLILVASPAYLREMGVPRKLSELTQHRAILFRGTNGTQRFKLSGPTGTESVVVRGPIQVDEVGFQLPLAERGVGIAFVPALLVGDSLRAGRLVRVLAQYARKEGSLYLVHPPQRQVPKRVSLLRDFLFDALKRDLSSEA